jgi:hypothetical protein
MTAIQIALEILNREKGELAAEIDRLRALKTPASTQLLNIIKGCLVSAEAENERLEAALRQIASYSIDIDKTQDSTYGIAAMARAALEPKP